MTLALLLVSLVSALPVAQPREERLTLYVSGSKAGQLLNVDTPHPDGSWTLMRGATLEVKRGAQALSMNTETVAEVGPGFQPRRFKYTRQDSSGTLVMEGVATCSPGCNLDLRTTIGGVTQTQTLKLSPGVTFASALEVQARQGLKDGARYKGEAFIEELGAVAPLAYEVKTEGTGFLVRTTMTMGTSAVETLDHLDAAGRVLRSETPAMDAVAVQEGSPGPVGSGEKALDVLAMSTWTGPRLPANVKRVRFELKTNAPELSPVPEDRRQRVIQREKNRFIVEVDRNPKGPAEKLTTAQRQRYLAATPYEPVGDARLVAAAKKARGDAKKPRDVISRVTLFVNELVDEKNLSRAYAPALVTLESRQGDCTEHSVLTSALLRQSGIPTRLADGVIAMSNGKLGYHEWVEAYVDGEGWIPVDPTFGEPEAGPNRVKFANGSSQNEDLVNMGLSAAQAFRGLHVSVEGYDE